MSAGNDHNAQIAARGQRPGGPEPEYAEHPGFGIWPCKNPWHTARRTEGLPMTDECPDCPNRWWAWDGTPCPEEYALLAEIRWLRGAAKRHALAEARADADLICAAYTDTLRREEQLRDALRQIADEARSLDEAMGIAKEALGDDDE